MVDLRNSTQPLVTVIITCYNQGKYLTKAIESVKNQSYPRVELVVVDDGSTDNTAGVSRRYPFLKYLYQQNAGLAAARNAGINASEGAYLVFLDADDWLLPDALQVNFNYLSLYEEHAFVSGAFQLFWQPSNEYWDIQKSIPNNHYLHFLEGNYIGMHAAVMYRRWVFEFVNFDPARKYCEDYDLYLRISRDFEVIHHTHTIAVYRQHGENMSTNNSAMLHAATDVLLSQQKLLTSEAERRALDLGLKNWKGYYAEKLYKSLIDSLYSHRDTVKQRDIQALKAHNRALYNKFRLIKKQLFPSYRRKVINTIVNWVKPLEQNRKLQVGKVSLGDLKRTTPFSEEFGYDRGGPIDRYYIEKFLAANAAHIFGRVLEIGDNEYTMRFGNGKVQISDVLHVDSSNPKATIIGDLSNAPQLDNNSFDCIILTQTLQLIYNYKDAIETCFRILKPGGALLITVPGISQIASDQWENCWYWSFTTLSMNRILKEYFAEDKVKVNASGNVLLATAFLYGMGIGEMKAPDLEIYDPHYQLLISALAVKQDAGDTKAAVPC